LLFWHQKMRVFYRVTEFSSTAARSNICDD
jgi:hypothetical protein